MRTIAIVASFSHIRDFARFVQAIYCILQPRLHSPRFDWCKIAALLDNRRTNPLFVDLERWE